MFTDPTTEAIVNTVNCVGVMGKGIALQCKQLYPDVYWQYREACQKGQLVPGKMLVTSTGPIEGRSPKYIIHFPTKRHWRMKSILADIEAGLRDLRSHIIEYDITSVSIPALGCGNGGLNWNDVKPLIIRQFQNMSDCLVVIYEPQS